MATAHDLYRLLGIRPTASADEIRAAYLKLLKRHHPDLSPGRDGESNYVAALNAAFATLRDPRRRAEYDAQSAGRMPSAPAGAPVWHTPAARVASPPTGAIGRFMLGFLAPLTLIIIGGELLRGAVFDDVLGLGQPSVALADVPERASRPMHIPAKAAAAAVRQAAALSIEDAMRVSRDCFRGTAGATSPELALRCVVFDNAVVMLATRDAYRDGVPPYFRMQWTRARHLDALAEWETDPNPTLARLSAMTLRLLLRDLRHDPAAGATADLIAEAHSGVPRPAPPTALPIPESGQVEAKALQLTQNKLGLATQGD